MECLRCRHASAGDALQIAVVHIDSWRATYAGMVDPEVLASFSYDTRAERWKEWIAEKKTSIIVAESGRRIVGFCRSGPARDMDPRFTSEIYALYILKNCQQRGIGRELLRLSARQLLADGFNSTMTWVLADNPARKFYEKLGGRLTGERAITIGLSDLEEVSYGWTELERLL